MLGGGGPNAYLAVEQMRGHAAQHEQRVLLHRPDDSPPGHLFQGFVVSLVVSRGALLGLYAEGDKRKSQTFLFVIVLYFCRTFFGGWGGVVNICIHLLL